MTEIAKAAGLSREQLYRSFGEQGNPILKTLLAVMKAPGIQFAVKGQAEAKVKPHKVKKAA